MKPYQQIVEWVLLGVLIRSCLHQVAVNPATKHVIIPTPMGLPKRAKAAAGVVSPMQQESALDECALFI